MEWLLGGETCGSIFSIGSGQRSVSAAGSLSELIPRHLIDRYRLSTQRLNEKREDVGLHPPFESLPACSHASQFIALPISWVLRHRAVLHLCLR